MFLWGKKKENEKIEEEKEDSESQEASQVSSSLAPELLPPIYSTEVEKATVLRMFSELRNEGTFCDVAFLCQGVLFRAHRTVVSAWSRWLRALLCEGPEEEVISLDVFSSSEFGAVLNYMYGASIDITVENCEPLIKIIRRLEMQELEQQCWKRLMTLINHDNCAKLHELADRYDCPPLKLTAWKVLQLTVPGYASAPEILSEDALITYKAEGNGFTGPGELPYPAKQSVLPWEEDEEEGRVSIFAPADFEGDTDAESEAGDEAEDKAKKQKKEVPHPDTLPSTASAREVVAAWARHLQDVYQKCAPENASQYAEFEADVPALLEDSPKRQVGKHHDNKALYDWRKELIQFYTAANMPDQLKQVDRILATWKGQEHEMLGALLTKHGRKVPRELFDHLSNLLNLVDTQTEVSSRSPEISKASPHRKLLAKKYAK